MIAIGAIFMVALGVAVEELPLIGIGLLLLCFLRCV